MVVGLTYEIYDIYNISRSEENEMLGPFIVQA